LLIRRSSSNDYFKKVDASTFWFYTAYNIGKLLNSNKKLARRIRNLGDIADYLLWIQYTFPNSFNKSTFIPTNEILWKKVISKLNNSEITVFEFGVAYGYATNWWLSNFPNYKFNWHGFDSFIGLPRAWRDIPQGYFNANGLAPKIHDTRVTWHVGDVKETLLKMNVEPLLTNQTIILFDFDIYEPSLFAWNSIKEHLKVGDILYFDEAFDNDERHLIKEEILKFCQLELIGATPVSLAVTISDLKR
jgi:hypothetical protein